MRKRINLEECSSCGRPLEEQQKVCRCGSPTPFMSFDERNRFEVERWRSTSEEKTA